MGQPSGHIVRVAGLIKPNVPHHVTRVPEIDERELAFCHAPYRVNLGKGFPRQVSAECAPQNACYTAFFFA
jgi:hypothetical protein